MAKLNRAINPVTGKEFAVNISTIWSMILGVLAILFAVTAGQKVGNIVSGKVPQADFTPDPFISERQTQPKDPFAWSTP